MTTVYIHTAKTKIVYCFAYRFQARSWLLLNGFLKEDGNSYEHISNGLTATLDSRMRGE
jgi:hypothetical protein